MAEETLYVVAAVVVIGGIVAVVALRELRRARARASVARQLGMTFAVLGELVLPDGAERLSLLAVGRTQSVCCGASGQIEEKDSWIFDWLWESGQGRSYTCQTTVVAIVRWPGLDLPHFVLRPETLRPKLAETLSGVDIDFECHPRFSSRYQLCGEEEAAIREHFSATVLQTLEERLGLSVEGWGDLLLVCRAERTDKPREATALLENAHSLVAALTFTERTS